MRNMIYFWKVTPLVLYIVEVIDEFQCNLTFNRNKTKAILEVCLGLFRIILETLPKTIWIKCKLCKWHYWRLKGKPLIGFKCKYKILRELATKNSFFLSFFWGLVGITRSIICIFRDKKWFVINKLKEILKKKIDKIYGNHKG